jgi:hypothetical protein
MSIFYDWQDQFREDPDERNERLRKSRVERQRRARADLAAGRYAMDRDIWLPET